MKLIDADKLINKLTIDQYDCVGCPEPEWLQEFISILNETEEVNDISDMLWIPCSKKMPNKKE